jgi:uncharacterized protein
MGSLTKSEIRPLARESIHALVARNHLGRMAYSRGHLIDIEPVHYVYHEGWIYGCASRDVDLETMGTSWWPLALEVDEVDGPHDWRCVVVRGGFYTLSPRGAAWERAEYERAIEILQALPNAAEIAVDRTADSAVLFRIAVQEVTGRASTPEGVEAPDMP